MPVESSGPTTTTYKYLYLPVAGKFVVALGVSILWAWMAVWMAQRWIMDLSVITGMLLAQLIIWGIAVIPGFMNAFLVASLLMDRRPPFAPQVLNQQLPPITILVAAYNEAANILATLESIDRQNYPGKLSVIVVNDGSSDNTLALLSTVSYPWLRVLDMGHNVGKARALTKALELVDTSLTLTVDGDSYLYTNALANLIRRYLSDPKNTRAVAGAVAGDVARIQAADFAGQEVDQHFSREIAQLDLELVPEIGAQLARDGGQLARAVVVAQRF